MSVFTVYRLTAAGPSEPTHDREGERDMMGVIVERSEAFSQAERYALSSSYARYRYVPIWDNSSFPKWLNIAP